MEVELWPVSKQSQSLSFLFGKPLMPPYFRSVVKAFPPAGEKLMGIGLMAHIPDDLVLRKIKGQMQAMVSSTTPRLEARWPPVH